MSRANGPGKGQHRRPQVDEAHEALIHRSGFYPPRPAYDERNPDPRVVRPAFGPWQSLAMIAPQYDDRVVDKSVLLELIEQFAEEMETEKNLSLLMLIK